MVEKRLYGQEKKVSKAGAGFIKNIQALLVVLQVRTLFLLP